MKFTRNIVLAASMGLSLTTGALFAGEAKDTAPSHNGAEAVKPSMTGRKVMDTKGNELGTISRVIDKEDKSGPRYAVMRDGSGLETVVPYSNFGMKEPDRITLDATPERMSAAPKWESEESAESVNRYWDPKTTSFSPDSNRKNPTEAGKGQGLNASPDTNEGTATRTTTETRNSGSDNSPATKAGSAE